MLYSYTLDGYRHVVDKLYSSLTSLSCLFIYTFNSYMQLLYAVQLLPCGELLL